MIPGSCHQLLLARLCLWSPCFTVADRVGLGADDLANQMIWQTNGMHERADHMKTICSECAEHVFICVFMRSKKKKIDESGTGMRSCTMHSLPGDPNASSCSLLAQHAMKVKAMLLKAASLLQKSSTECASASSWSTADTVHDWQHAVHDWSHERPEKASAPPREDMVPGTTWWMSPLDIPWSYT